MGLDWLVDTKPRAGHEDEVRRLRALLEQPLTFEEVSATEAALAEIEVTKFETAGCPRVGFDPAADAFATARIAPEDRPAFLEAHRGKYVVELAQTGPPAPAAHGILASSLDFRGSLVGRMDALPHALQDEAFEDHTPEEAAAFADRLAAAAASLVPADAQTVQAAVAWLRFWSARGHGFRAWC